MSGDEKKAQDIAAGDEKMSDTETSSFGESLASEETICRAGEELLIPGASVAGSSAEEGFLAGAIDRGSTEEDSLAGAVGGCGEASTASETVLKSKVLVGIEDLQKALLRNAKHQPSQFQDIKDDLVEIIRDLKELSRRNPGNWEIFESLRVHIKEANVFLAEINEAMIVFESKELYMNLHLNQFFERLRERGECLAGVTFNLGTIEDANVELQAASRSSDAQEREGPSAAENVDRSHLGFVDQMMPAASFRSRTGEMDDTKEVKDSVGIEAAGGAAEEPERMEVVVDDDDDDDIEFGDRDRDEEGRLLHPPVSGKYTLAITAHKLYPESSSEDSPEQELPPGAEGGSPRHIQQGNVRDVRTEDPSRGNGSSDSSNDEHRDHYGL